VIDGAWVLSALLVAAPSDAKASAAWWIEVYGQVRPEDHAPTRMASELLERLWRAAGQRLGLAPRLVVLNDSRPNLLALALPDNTILISRAGLDFCLGRGLLPREAEARLGLVLAHELDHLLRVDDWHVAAFSADSVSTDDLSTLVASRDVRFATELRADADAVLLLSQAGIDAAPALRPVSFLEQWVASRQAAWQGGGTTHPDTSRRAQTMRQELKRLVDALPSFHAGVRQLDAGAARAALTSFDEFHRRTRYAGKELLTNIGLGNYLLALEALTRCDPRAVVRFRLDTLPARTLTFAGTHHRGPRVATCLAEPLVEQPLATAVARLNEAVALDPGYLPARLNLLAALVLADRTPDAYAVAAALVDGVRAVAPADARHVAARNAYALCSYLMRRSLGGSDDDALRELQALQDGREPDQRALYNYARALQETGRSALARDTWSRYLRSDATGPYAEAARAALASLGGPTLPVERVHRTN